jgi:hypothetical protein
MSWSLPVSIRRTRWERAVVAARPARPPRGPTARSAHRSNQARTSSHHHDRRSSKSEDQGRGRTGSRRTGLVSSGAGRKGGFLFSFAWPPAPGPPEAVDDMTGWPRRRRVVPSANTGSPLPFGCVWAEPDWARSDPITKPRSGPNRGQIFGFPNLQHRSRSLSRPHNNEEWQWRAPATTQSCRRPLSSPLRSSRVVEVPFSAEEPAGQVKVSFLSLLERTHSLSWAANLVNFALLPCYILLLVHKFMLAPQLALQTNGHFDNKCMVISVLRLTFCYWRGRVSVRPQIRCCTKDDGSKESEDVSSTKGKDVSVACPLLLTERLSNRCYLWKFVMFKLCLELKRVRFPSCLLLFTSKHH